MRPFPGTTRRQLLLGLLAPALLLVAVADHGWTSPDPLDAARESLMFRLLKPFYGPWDYQWRQADFLGETGYLAAHQKYLARLQPLNLEVRWTLIEMLARIGDRPGLAAAVTDYRAALARHGAWSWRRYNLWFYEARSYGIAGDHEKAVELHEKNYRSWPAWTANLNWIAEARLAQGRVEEADRWLSLYAQRSGFWAGSRPWAETLGGWYERTARPAKAEGCYRRYLGLASWDLWAWQRLYLATPREAERRLAVARGYAVAAVKTLENFERALSWLQEDGFHAAALVLLGEQEHYYLGAATGLFAQLLRARVLEGAGKHAEAAGLYAKVAKTREAQGAPPGEIFYYLPKIAFAYLRAGDRAASDSWSAARLADPAFAEERAFLAAEAALIAGDPLAAERAVIELANGPAGTWSRLDYQVARRYTLLCERYGRKGAALALWKAVAARTPNPVVDMEYARQLTAAGQHEPALRAAMRAYADAPYIVEALPEIAWLAARLGVYGQARTALARALCLQGPDWVRERLGTRHPDLVAALDKAPRATTRAADRPGQ